MVRSVEITVPIVVLLTVWRAGVPIMTLNGKSRLIQEEEVMTDTQAQEIREQTGAENHKPKNSRLAIGAFVCGLISSLSFYIGRFLAERSVFSRDVKDFMFGFTTWSAPPLFCIASILLCIMALISIKQSKGELRGKGLAIWGPAISIAQIILFILRLTYGPWGGPVHW